MRRLVLTLANFVSQVSPLTRWFGLRRALYSMAGVSLSHTARICATARIHHSNLEIGDESWIGTGAEIIPTSKAKVRIGNRCDIGPDVLVVTGSHEIGDQHRRAGVGFSSAIFIGDGTWIGARSTFLGGAIVGSGCVVAAGSLVTSQFPANVLVAGTPAKIIRALPEQGAVGALS